MSQAHKHSPRKVRVIILALILAAGCALWFYMRQPSDDEGVISLSGRIESDDASVSAKVSGRLRVGQPARVYLDSKPDRPIEAIVSRIDPQASFTPKNTYFRDDRIKQVVGVKLQIINPQGFAKPGMPADGEVLVEAGDRVAQDRRQR